MSWYDNGNTREDGEFKENKKHGVWSNFTFEGELEKKMEFKEGKRV
jgi:antitoxin component YwqK of YwqJK toxin-antitoxin module